MLIPGDAPALAEVHITHSGGAAAPIWGLIAWWEKPQNHNLVWNGDFDLAVLGVSGWSVAAVANICDAATSRTRITTASKYPSGSLEVVCPADADSGASFRIFRRFKRGVTYTFEAWVQSAAHTTAVYPRLGNSASGDFAGSGGGGVNLSTSWQRISNTWTPTADRADAHFAVNLFTATATTFRIDGVMVYEGTTAPTTENQLYGRGGYPPIGILEAENNADGTVVVDATARSGYKAEAQGSLSWNIDPALLVADPHTQDEISLEVWARVSIPSTMTSLILTLAAKPISADATQPKRYTPEYGSAGKSVVIPTATAWRFVKLGTLILSTGLGRWWLHLARTLGGSGTAYYDYLVLVPSQARALSPTGKANDSSFPAFIGGTAEIRKIIHADLSATLSRMAGQALEPIATAGLGGSPSMVGSSGTSGDRTALALGDSAHRCDAALPPGAVIMSSGMVRPPFNPDTFTGVKQPMVGEYVGNCIAACVATILDVELEDLPPLSSSLGFLEFYDELRDWLHQRHLDLEPVAVDEREGSPPGTGWWIASIDYANGRQGHATVWYDRLFVWDPYPDRGKIYIYVHPEHTITSGWRLVPPNVELENFWIGSLSQAELASRRRG